MQDTLKLTSILATKRLNSYTTTHSPSNKINISQKFDILQRDKTKKHVKGHALDEYDLCNSFYFYIYFRFTYFVT